MDTTTRVGFTGPFSDANLGDYGMLINNILDLSDEVESFAIFSYDTTFVTQLDADYFGDISVTVSEVVLDSSMVERVAQGYEASPFELLQSVENYEELRQAIGALDVLVVNGGGFFNELWCQPHRIGKLLSIIVPLLIADEVGIRVVFSGNGFGPFGDRSRPIRAMLTTLTSATYFVRDRVGSMAELRQMGVSPAHIHFVPDDLFIASEKLPSAHGGVLPSRRYVVFETYHSIKYLEQNRDKIAEFAGAVEAQGYSVVVMPFYAGRGGGEQATWLASNFGWYQIELDDGYLGLGRAREVIANAEFVIADRYHAIVLALANGVPSIHSLRPVLGSRSYYYRKSRGILDTALRGASLRLRDHMTSSPVDSLERLGTEGVGVVRNRQMIAFNSVLSENVALAKQYRSRMLKHVIYGIEVGA